MSVINEGKLVNCYADALMAWEMCDRATRSVMICEVCEEESNGKKRETFKRVSNITNHGTVKKESNGMKVEYRD